MNLIPIGIGREMLPEKMCQDQHHLVRLMVLDWEDQTRCLVTDLDSIQMCLGGTGHAMFLEMHCKSLNLMSILVQMDLVAQNRSPVMVGHKQNQNPDGIGLEMFQMTVSLVLKQTVLMVLLTNQVGQMGCHERFPMMVQTHQDGIGQEVNLGSSSLAQTQCQPLNLQDLEDLRASQGM